MTNRLLELRSVVSLVQKQDVLNFLFQTLSWKYFGNILVCVLITAIQETLAKISSRFICNGRLILLVNSGNSKTLLKKIFQFVFKILLMIWY